MKTKFLAILAVIVIVAAGATAAFVLTNNHSNNENRGLYALNATVMSVDMGGMSSTPKMVETVEYLYSEVYGKLADGANNLTIDDAKADKTFWDTYCKYTSMVTVNSDGSITYKTPTTNKTNVYTDITIPHAANKLISTGTAYPVIIYYALCYKYNVEPFSDAAFKNTDLVNEFRSINYGSLILPSVETSTPELVKYYGDSYVEHCKSIKGYDLEQMATDVETAKGTDNTVILMGSATLDKDNNNNFYKKVTTSGGYIALNTATSIPTTFAGIELVCTLFGLSDYLDDLLENLELRLYKVYWSVQQKGENHKAYFESSSGKASKNTGSGAELCKFLGFDISLFTGAEVDTETLLTQKPDVMIYYTNDERSMDEKMRVTS